MSRLQQARGRDADVRIVGRGVGQIEKRLIVTCPLGKHRHEPHGPTIDRQEPIGQGPNAGAVKPSAQRRNAGIGMGQDKDGFFAIPVPCKALGNQVGFAAPGRGGHSAASN